MMRELIISNGALGDRNALEAMLATNGYWFFKGVLDAKAIGEMRDRFMEQLVSQGLIDKDADEPIWNGADLGDIGDGLTNAKVPALRHQRIWENFVERPEVNAFFESVLGAPLEWLTSSDFYRVVPPSRQAVADRFAGRHQDGLGLQGLDFMTCWIPLATATAAVGGLALAVDSFSGDLFHKQWFDPEKVPIGGWARSDYEPGDVVMFPPAMLHSGLPNTSDRFRLSLDIRVLRPCSRRPIYGSVAAIDADHVVINPDRGAEQRLAFDDSSHLRGMTPQSDIPILISRETVADYLPVGSRVMATSTQEKILVLRPHGY